MRGKFNKRRGNGGRNSSKGRKSKQDKFHKPKKTYSIYKNGAKEINKKRKFQNDSIDEDSKRIKEDVVPQEVPEESSSNEEEEDEVDNMQQLLGTFKNTQKLIAIDSSSESEEETENTNEIDSNEETDDYSDEDLEEEADSNDSQSDVEESKVDTIENPTEELAEDEDDKIEPNLGEVDDSNEEDPFVKHCLYEINESLLKTVSNSPINYTTHAENWPELGKLLIQIPKSEPEKLAVENDFTISEQKSFATAGTVPLKISLTKNTNDNLFIKPKIAKNIRKANSKHLPSSHGEDKLPLNSFQAEIFSILNNYQDLYCSNRTFENGEEIRLAYCLHAINHIIKTRLKVIHHNARLAQKDDVPEEFRDQGLTRPKILIVLPFRDAAFRVINMLIDLLLEVDKGNVMNKNRFVEEFTGNELVMPKKNPKPEDYERLFAGNSNDDFKIGITVTKKSLKLYADFYSSDIIIASPLGLRPIIGADGEPERDYDFLASIELLILDQADVFLMQNWDHLLHIFKHLHLQPKDSHGTDFSRVRTWSLNGWAKFYRQTVIISSTMLPELNSLYNKQCNNYAGKVKIANPVVKGTIAQVYVQLPHVYHKFQAQNSTDAIEARFQFFVRKILPQQKDAIMKQTLIYFANYFDYVRVRNYFKKEDIGFVQICEYSKDAKIARARDMFFHGDAHFLLYTERHHFFNRIRLKGIRHLVFYQPPNVPHFYFEMCNLMQEGNMNKKVGNQSNMTVNVIFSKYDAQQLSAIVGTERATKMVTSDKNVYMLLTD